MMIFLTSMTSGQTCGDIVLDPGGASNYPNNSNWTQTYTGASGDTMVVVFNSFNTESSYDFLYVYDGPSTSSPLLAQLHGDYIPADIVASGNSVTLRFTSDGSVQRPGFELEIQCNESSSPCNSMDCTEEYVFEWYDGSSGPVWPISNGEALISNVYTISGAQGDYNVTVTLNNPDCQNIDFSNCTVVPEAAYTATCNDPNGSTECDGDNTTVDTQFSYGCSYLTFGVTSDNSAQYTSITYDFDYPAYICDLEIGDIDFSPASNPALTSYQDEVDVTADSMGVAVNLSAATGSAVDVFNNNTSNIKLLADYDNVTGGDILPTDPRGHAYVTSETRVTSITFTYSNGPEDDGLSDDHAIRLAGFSFCPEVQGPCDSCEDYYLEPECGTMGANWLAVDDNDASEGKYVTINPPANSFNSAPTSVDDIITLNVNVSSAGNYNAFGRVRGATGNDDSFWVRANGGTWYKWNSWSSLASSFSWVQVYDSDNSNAIVTFDLIAGNNTIDISYREDGAHLDKFLLSPNDELPTGTGGFAFNCPEICDNGYDDDHDGLTDCEDDDCIGVTDCQGPCDVGQILVQRWFGISSTEISTLTSLASYPNTPDEIAYNYNFDGPNNYADNFGTRAVGYIVPSESGTYSFNITGDDNTELYLSTSNDEADKSLIASFAGWTNEAEHSKYPSQTSVDIDLLAGVWYFVELITKEGGGGDHFETYWKTPSNSSNWVIIPGNNLAPLECPEICDNNVDDDGDGDEDCLDDDCINGINISAGTNDDEICVGESTNLTATYTGTPGLISYLWSGGAGTTPNVTVTPSATTTYTVTVTNSGGCTSSSQVQIVVNDPPVASASNDGTLTCANTSVTLTANPAGMSYAWSGGGSGRTKSVTVGGTYTVTVTDGNGCSATANTTVNTNTTSPTANAGSDDAICLGEATTLTASGGVSYLWEDGSTNANRVVSPLVTTTYTVEVMAANGCVDSDNVTVTINTLPSATINNDGPITISNK